MSHNFSVTSRTKDAKWKLNWVQPRNLVLEPKAQVSESSATVSGFNIYDYFNDFLQNYKLQWTYKLNVHNFLFKIYFYNLLIFDKMTKKESNHYRTSNLIQNYSVWNFNFKSFMKNILLKLMICFLTYGISKKTWIVFLAVHLSLSLHIKTLKWKTKKIKMWILSICPEMKNWLHIPQTMQHIKQWTCLEQTEISFVKLASLYWIVANCHVHVCHVLAFG